MKLIPKDAVLAEIDKKMAKCFGNATDFATGKKMALSELKASINSLEVKVKEVDLDKELKDWMRDNTDSADFFDLPSLVKHFFELGLKAQKGE